MKKYDGMYYYGKAPVRISFGSSADTKYYMDLVGRGTALNATINSYCHCTIKKRSDEKISLVSQVSGEEVLYNNLSEINFNSERSLNLMKAAILHYKNIGIDVVTYSDAPIGSGLGGSAAHTVSIIRAFNSLNKIKMSAEQVAKLAYRLERTVLGIEGGYQDQYAAAYRGINYFVFAPTNVKTNSISLSDKDLTNLEEHLLLIYIPRINQGENIHVDQKKRGKENVALLKEKRKNVEELTNALKKCDFEYFATLLKKDWEIKKRLSPLISIGKVNEIYEKAITAGAIGGRFLGAGGGGCAIFYAENTKKVFESLKKFGVTKMPFKFERKIVQIESYVKNTIQEHQAVISSMFSQNLEIIQEITKKCVECYKTGGKIVLFGNGGSAADAQHIAGELVNKMYLDRPMLNSVALTVNTSVLTAIANDTSYEDIFSRQVENQVKEKDVVIGISTSGNSKNVLKGIEESKKQGVYTIGFTGKTGGKLKEIVDLCLQIPSDNVARIQEGHILAGHIVCENIEKALFGDSND